MDRYILAECEKSNFQKVDILPNWNKINYKKIVEEVINQNELFQFEYFFDSFYGGNYTKNYLKEIFFSTECQIDIFSEIYLSILRVKDEKVDFYCNGLEKIKTEGRSAEKTIEDNIKNGKRKNNKGTKIFDTKNIEEEGINTRISCVGANLQRFWYSSKKFRNLFNDTVTRNEKYQIKKIVQELEGFSQVLHFDRSDYIILEKLLGLNTWYYYNKLIVNDVENIKKNKGMLIKLLSQIMKYPGNFSRCSLIDRLVQSKICYQGTANFSMDQMLQKMLNLLKDEIESFAKYYKEITEKILNEVQCKYTIDTSIIEVERIIQELEEKIYIGTIKFQNNKSNLKPYVDKLMKNHEEENIYDILSKIIYDFTREQAVTAFPFLSKERICNEPLYEEQDIELEIGKLIINQNFNRYNHFNKI